MTKHSKVERERRKSENADVERIQAAWSASLKPAVAAEFNERVAAVKARGPLPPPPDMAPGTLPNPPRPGREPKPPKTDTRAKRRY